MGQATIMEKRVPPPSRLKDDIISTALNQPNGFIAPHADEEHLRRDSSNLSHKRDKVKSGPVCSSRRFPSHESIYEAPRCRSASFLGR